MGPDPASILSVLEAQPLWRCGRAVDMAMFHFGRRNQRTTRQGQQADATMPSTSNARGESCVGTTRSLDPETSSTWSRRARAGEIGLLDEILAPSLVVEGIEASSAGLLVLRFLGEAHLEVLPDRRESQDEDVEHWRFFSPGDKAPHLVYHSSGFELE